MSERTKIEWTDSTFNPWIGCTKVGPGCDHCYAERDMDHRRGRAKWGAGQPRSRTSPEYWKGPIRWERQHAAFFAEHGRRRRVFCASLADVFDNEVDPGWRRDLFDLIRATPNLDWLLLTKRIGIAQRLFEECHPTEVGSYPWPDNVWLGATTVTQEEVERDAPKLLRIQVRIRFLSIEPILGDIDVRPFVWQSSRVHYCTKCGFRTNSEREVYCPNDSQRLRPDIRIDWVICGGESGPNARPMHPSWPRSLREQCAAAGVAFLFKQWGEWAPSELARAPAARCVVTQDGEVLKGARMMDRQDEKQAEIMALVGKRAAGRALDGHIEDRYPAAP